MLRYPCLPFPPEEMLICCVTAYPRRSCAHTAVEAATVPGFQHPPPGNNCGGANAVRSS